LRASIFWGKGEKEKKEKKSLAEQKQHHKAPKQGPVFKETHQEKNE